MCWGVTYPLVAAGSVGDLVQRYRLSCGGTITGWFDIHFINAIRIFFLLCHFVLLHFFLWGITQNAAMLSCHFYHSSLSQNRSILLRNDWAQTAWSCPDVLLVIQPEQILSKQFFFLITWSVQARLDSFAKGQSIRLCSTSRGNCGQSRFTSNKQNDLSGGSRAHISPTIKTEEARFSCFYLQLKLYFTVQSLTIGP